MEKITDNISVKKTLLNWWKVRNRVPNIGTGAERTAAKWTNSSYAVDMYNASNNNGGVIDPNNLPYFEAIGHTDSIISKHAYDKLYSIVEDVDGRYYNDVDAGRIDVVTDIAISIIQGSMTVYSMLCALFRSQNGYLYKDEDKVYLGPIFFNHDTKGISTTDWGITAGNNSFVEEIGQFALNNQQRILNSGQVWGCFGITNEQWGNLVTNILNATYMSKEMRSMCEHLFTKVFIDPSFSYNVRSVTFFPSSYMLTYANNGEDTWNPDPHSLSGYDWRFARAGLTQAYAEDNVSTWADTQNYFTAWEAFINEVFSYYPMLKDILAEFGVCANNSQFNFTRDLQHAKVTFVTEENVQDFVQSTACNNQNLESYAYGASLADFGSVISYSVQDESFLRYGRSAEYPDEIEISLMHSFEYALKGKLRPLRFAYYGADNNAVQCYYRYQFLVPSTISAIGTAGGFSVVQATNLYFCNSDLNDFGAIYPLHNDIYQGILADGMGAPEMVVIPSTRCYFNPVENLGLYVGRAWDTLLNIK